MPKTEIRVFLERTDEEGLRKLLGKNYDLGEPSLSHDGCSVDLGYCDIDLLLKVLSTLDDAGIDNRRLNRRL